MEKKKKKKKKGKKENNLKKKNEKKKKKEKRKKLKKKYDISNLILQIRFLDRQGFVSKNFLFLVNFNAFIWLVYV